MYLGILSSDPNWERSNKHIGVTRRFLVATAVLTIALLLLLLPVFQFALFMFSPVPFEYRNLPFRVCGPESTVSQCVPIQEGEVFHSGDVVPFVVDRCASDPFARTAVLPYVVSRNVVNDVTGTRIIMPSLSTEIPTGGCATSVTVAHQLPDTIAPGTYYLEGVATAYGRFRVVNAYFRTESFVIAKKDEQ